MLLHLSINLSLLLLRFGVLAHIAEDLLRQLVLLDRIKLLFLREVVQTSHNLGYGGMEGCQIPLLVHFGRVQDDIL